MSEQLKKDYRIKIFLLKDFTTSNDEYWIFIEKYMSFKFLNRVKAFKNFIQ